MKSRNHRTTDRCYCTPSLALTGTWHITAPALTLTVLSLAVPLPIAAPQNGCIAYISVNPLPHVHGRRCHVVHLVQDVGGRLLCMPYDAHHGDLRRGGPSGGGTRQPQPLRAAPTGDAGCPPARSPRRGCGRPRPPARPPAAVTRCRARCSASGCAAGGGVKGDAPRSATGSAQLGSAQPSPARLGSARLGSAQLRAAPQPPSSPAPPGPTCFFSACAPVGELKPPGDCV